MKRIFDVCATVLSAPFWVPIFLLVSLGVLVAMGRPVFHIADRAGRGGRVFRFWKFRTMRIGAGSDAERLTRFGRFLRRTSLDELPQLFHVLSGRMSLVGPRPLPAAYLARYSPEQARRHEVRPGITGWAQVNGRNGLDWAEKFRLDVWYVDHRSLALDLRILLQTVRSTLCGTGVSHAGYDTMYEFKGESTKV